MSFADIEFAHNPDPRCPVVLVLDTSGSMADARPGHVSSPLAALQDGLETLVKELSQDTLASRRVELAIISIGSSVEVLSDFATVDNVTIPKLEAMGPTPLGAGISKALDMLESRKASYRRNGVAYYRPWMIVITDGVPTDDIAAVSSRVKEAEEKKSIAFFPVAVEGADLDALAAISVRTPLLLKGVNFNELFVWLSASATRVSSSRPGDAVDLPPVTGWAQV